MKWIAALLIATATFLATATTARAQSEEPWVGTWKVDLTQSKYSPGPVPATPATVKIEAVAGGGMKTTIDSTDSAGKPTHTETTGMFDQKDNAVTGTAAPNTTTAYRRIDERTFEAMGKVNGKPTVTTRVTISPDGKMLTATQTGKT